MRVLGIFWISLCLAAPGCANHAARGAGDGPSRNIFTMVERADLAYEQGRWLEAGQLYQAVAQAVPDDHYAWFRLGNSHLYQGQLDAAIYQYQQAMQRDNRHAKTYFNLSIAYTMQALAALDAASQSLRPGDPGQSLAYERMAGLRAVLGDSAAVDGIRPADEPAGYFETNYEE